MRNGFSLVELSIVLVILGLLTGGILTGQSLIRAAELRAVTTEFQNYQTAVMTFRDKYIALPGDMTTATDFWGQMTNCGVASPSGTGTQTCNGDGNGRIDAAPGASQSGERFGFWQHLANAGLIEGSYTGIAGSIGPQDVIFGENVPPSKLGNAGWSTAYWNATATPSAEVFVTDFSSHLVFGTKNATNGAPTDPALTPGEAWSIDKKLDDGLPGRGRIVVSIITDCTEAANNTDFDAPYALSESSVVCAFKLLKLF